MESSDRVQVYITYLEIYNSEGYDLLDREEGKSNLKDLNKVKYFETGEKNLVF